MSVMAESHWDKVDGLVFSDVRCQFIEAEFFSALVMSGCYETDKVSVQETNKNQQGKV